MVPERRYSPCHQPHKELKAPPQSQKLNLVKSHSETYPAWVAVIYHPVFVLFRDGDNALSALYERYLDWWEKSPDPLP